MSTDNSVVLDLYASHPPMPDVGEWIGVMKVAMVAYRDGKRRDQRVFEMQVDFTADEDKSEVSGIVEDLTNIFTAELDAQGVAWGGDTSGGDDPGLNSMIHREVHKLDDLSRFAAQRAVGKAFIAMMVALDQKQTEYAMDGGDQPAGPGGPSTDPAAVA